MKGIVYPLDKLHTHILSSHGMHSFWFVIHTGIGKGKNIYIHIIGLSSKAL